MSYASDPRETLVDRREDAPLGLFLAASGVWFSDGDRVRHAGLSQLLHHSVARDTHGALIVTTGRDVAPFVAEDAPLIARTLDLSGPAALVLAGGESIPMAGRFVWMDEHGRMRTVAELMGRGRFWVLLSRTATQLVVEHIDDNGRLAWPSGGDATLGAYTGTGGDWSAPPPFAITG